MYWLKQLFHFNPTLETLVAFISAAVMVPVYYIGTHYQNGLFGFLIFIIFGNLLLHVLFPVFYIVFIKKSTLTDLGITTRWWKTSLFLSLLLALTSVPMLVRMSASVPYTVLIHNVIFNFISLWEPFFVFGWLLLCFDRAFGSVFGIILAILCFLAYHLGSYPLMSMMGMGIATLVIGILFRFTKNLLVLWPLGWGVSSTIGTLQGHLNFTWDDIVIYLIILVIQLGFIFYCYRFQVKSSVKV